jgi:hypothetical protein
MSKPISEIKTELEQIDDVDEVLAYPADYDLCSPDIIRVEGTDSERVTQTIRDAVTDDETALNPQEGTYVLYDSAAKIISPNGSKWDVLGSSDRKYEAILVEPGSEETSTVGEVLFFDREDTDYRLKLDSAQPA